MIATRLACALLLASACGRADRIVLATTSSAYDSGLMTEITRAWNASGAVPALHVIVTGSGEALALGRRGDADVLLVHAPEAEVAFMNEGSGLIRLPVMSNDMLLVGPRGDPAGISAAGDAADGMRRIDAGGVFVSRGDDSGTHQRELALRRAAGLPVPRAGPAYLEAGDGMAATLRIAAERQAYTLTDRATWDVTGAGLDLVAFTAAHALLHNPYSVIVPRQGRDTAAAAVFARWLSGAAGQAIIRGFTGPDGRPLFAPAAPEPAA